jgi:hypothetical protein
MAGKDMNTAREMVRIQLLLDGLGKPVDLNAVDSRAWHTNYDLHWKGGTEGSSFDDEFGGMRVA